jgi:D-alanyl-D-alanine carboxypeptidase
VQIAVSHRGQVIYSEAFGLMDVATPSSSATPRTVMQIASITKQFTAAAIIRLAERGALKLDDRIEKFVPEFDPRGRTITLRQLLTHTSGIPVEWVPAGPPWPDHGAGVTREEVIKALNNLSFAFKPGTQWSYSNAGYTLLGYAIESVTGMSFADFVRNEFALPLGLIDTGVCGTSNLPLPHGYLRVTSLWVPVVAVHPSRSFSSGSLCSTASDLARWSHLLATGRVVLPASYEMMVTPNNFVPYGLGLFVEPRLERAAVWHSGGIQGFRSFLLYFPDEEIAVAVLTNASKSTTDYAPFIALTVAKAALGTLATP